ncbi:MAG TPA: hypothetical protein VFN50_00510 [Acidimicrobiales bacterium]|nr:hypothetical protein [Acidimicrobiales bacterium]
MSSRRILVLAALAAPIVGMMALFAWTGATTTTSATSTVDSFLTAYNARDCQAMLGLLYRAPGSPPVSCGQLTAHNRPDLSHCTLGSSTSSSVHPPSGFVGLRAVSARCAQGSGSGAKAIDLDFYVATEQSTGTAKVVSIRYTGSS